MPFDPTMNVDSLLSGHTTFANFMKNGFDAAGQTVGQAYNPYAVKDVSQIPDYDAWHAQTQQGAAGAQGQLAGAQGTQGQLTSMLLNQAQGNGPSVAQNQLQQTTQNNIANAYAMAQANPNDPGAARMAGNQVANANQQAAGQGATLRAQEQLGAMGQLGQLSTSMAGQDQDMLKFYLGQGMSLAQAQQAANLAQQQLNMGSYYQGQQGMQKIFGGLANAGGAVAGLAAKGG